ncbi:metal dependent phosphohydrolase [Nitzschia inconspicua]|uniref:Metal dependent phosphohydrolase n=1 Tax=Nitzschia inconspicua TaxID=303405 RepID=A0A9K3P979_9STRA|nr:metal dependent phosphohydrolase [Nitzschia inconspicua]
MDSPYYASSVDSSASGVRHFSLSGNDDDDNNNNNDTDASSPPFKRLKSTGQEGSLRKLTYADKTQTNDEIHQSIEICPVMKAFVDTKVFQRLRHIHQLGTSQYVYMCGDHNRFQHSLGVAHLAERMCRNIKSEQPALRSTEKDVLCVKLAGLLHDIGHGPFSHVYEAFRAQLPNYLEKHPQLRMQYRDCKHPEVPQDWAHEDSSLIMLDAALAEMGLQIDDKMLDQPLKQIAHGPKMIDATTMRVFKPPNVKDGVLTSRDFIFIKECIYGKPLKENNGRFIGRQRKELEWLYDIVNNRHSGLDVDKIDYYARDHNRTIGSKSIDIKMIEDARVAKATCSQPEKCPTCNANGPSEHFMICYPSKRTEAAMNFFQERLNMHSTVYQHKKTTSVGCMLLDILRIADPFFRLRGTNGEAFPISRAANRPDYLLRLKDDVLSLIEHSDDNRLRPAQDLIERINGHDMYKCAVDLPLDVEVHDDMEDQCGKQVYEMSEHEIKTGILLEAQHWSAKFGFKIALGEDDFIVDKYCMHHGAKSSNPLERMRFFDEMSEKLFGPIDDLPTASAPKLSDYKCKNPTSFQKVGIRIYVREETKKGIVNQIFNQWFEGLKSGANEEPQNTPGFAQNEGEAMDGNENHDDYNNHRDFSGHIPLSQESVDGDDEDDERAQFYMDRSPIPLALFWV